MTGSEPSSAPTGLTTAQVLAERQRSGWNELPQGARVSPLRIFLRQFRGFLVVILIAAAAIAFTLGETIDAIAIGMVLILNAILGFVQEWKAETALDALRSMLTPQALALRDGQEVVLPARELVPGDLVIVSAGEGVPADLDIVTAADLKADESVVTGESVPVDKSPDGEGDARRLLTGTAVVAGRGEGIVTAIGASTSFGKIAEMTGSVGLKETHLQRQLGRLAGQIGLASLLIAGVIVALGTLVGRPVFEMFMTGLSLAVAMVPEGLPAVVTITLALGASTMARKKALARRLQAVETLGAASVICTDKTGTLTENKMTATRIWMSEREFRVTGSGYDPAGHIASNGDRVRAADDPALADLLDTAITCNHARLGRSGDDWVMTGAPTEGALVTLAYKGWADLPDPAATVAERPFSSERKSMIVVVRRGDGFRHHVKGAPEVVLGMCDRIRTADGDRALGDADRAVVHDAYEDMAAKGLRVIALASRLSQGETPEQQDMVFLGLVGLIDPPRPEVKDAVRGAGLAGIRIIMITGDSPVTARAIARDLGISSDECLDGQDIDALPDEGLKTLLTRDVLFARTRPEHKMRIVAVLQDAGHIVAMTGDGVNDAPALKRADIGIAMGIRGTDVSRNAADLVLLDDNFATIVNAIAEGRRQFDNLRKFVRYLLSSNAGEVLAIVVNLLLGGPLIFLATQILWMNLITDGVTAAALGLEKGERQQMEKPPRKPDEPILGIRGLLLIGLFGIYTGSASLWIFYSLLPQGEMIARTAAFTGMVVFEKLSVFAFRSLTQPCWRIGWFSNPFLMGALLFSLGLQVAAVYWPPLQVLLQTTGIPADVWLTILVLALPLVVVPELIKSTLPAGRHGRG
ncbi:MAG: cation-transporting P-type ATPase [Silicimonas sp.]